MLAARRGDAARQRVDGAVPRDRGHRLGAEGEAHFGVALGAEHGGHRDGDRFGLRRRAAAGGPQVGAGEVVGQQHPPQRLRTPAGARARPVPERVEARRRVVGRQPVVHQQRGGRARRLGLGLVQHHARVLIRLGAPPRQAEGRDASGPVPLAGDAANAVREPLDDVVAVELGRRPEHVAHEPPLGRRGVVELRGRQHEAARRLDAVDDVEQQPQVASAAVDAVDDHDLDESRLDVGHQGVDVGAVFGPAGDAVLLHVLANQGHARALDVGAGGLGLLAQRRAVVGLVGRGHSQEGARGQPVKVQHVGTSNSGADRAGGCC